MSEKVIKLYYVLSYGDSLDGYSYILISVSMERG